MMYIKNYFERMSLQQFRGFMQTGTEQYNDYRPYEERLKEDSKPLIERLKGHYPDDDEFSEVMGDISDAIGVYENVFFEIGMKAGARMMIQLLLEDEKPFKFGGMAVK